jgi:hypothetical protein
MFGVIFTPLFGSAINASTTNCGTGTKRSPAYDFGAFTIHLLSGDRTIVLLI